VNPIVFYFEVVIIYSVEKPLFFQMEVIDIATLVDDDDTDFGQGEQLVRDSKRVEQFLDEFKTTRSQASMEGLRDLAKSRDKNRAAMRVGGVLPILIEIIEGIKEPEMNSQQRAALDLLEAVCLNLPSREEMRRLSGIDPLVKLISLQSEEDLSKVFHTIALLADNQKNRAVLQQRGVLDAAIPRMRDSSPAIVQSVLHLISTMATQNKTVQDAIVKAGGVNDILAAALSKDIETRRLGVRALGAVCSNNRKVQALARRSKDALNSVVAMLHDEEPENRQQAGVVISYLADGDFTNQTALEKAGAMSALAQIIGSPDELPKTKEYACLALSSMTKGNMKLQKAWTEFEALIECISSPNVGTQVQALNALAELCTNNSTVSDKVLSLGVFTPLKESLKADIEPVQYRATSLLFALIHKSDHRKESLRQDPDIVPLLNALRGSGNPKVKQGAQWVLEQI